MNAEDIQTLLGKLGCNRIKITSGQWVHASCPFAPYTDAHKNRKDAHPSFGVSISDGVSGYKCFTCNANGNLTELLMRLRHLALQEGLEVDVLTDLFAWVQTRNKPKPVTIEGLRERLEKVEYRQRKAVEIGGIRVSESTARSVLRVSDGVFVPEDIPETFMEEAELDRFQPLSEEAWNYLAHDRGLSGKTIIEWGFRWHADSRRIAIPIRDCKGRLVGISGRSLGTESKRKFLHSTGYQRDRYLFGEHRLVEGSTGKGIVVEGFFDAIYLWQQGYKAVALLGTYPSKMQVEKLVRFFGEAVVLPDGDNAGYEAAERVAEALVGRMPVRIAPMPKGKDPDEVSPLDLMDALGSPERV
jgi:DNA primase